MELRLLGTAEVVDGAEVRRPDGGRARQLLSLLATRRGQAVSTGQLADELWEGDPPDSADTALRVHVNAVRKAFEPRRPRGATSAYVVATGGGYRLDLGDDEFDVARFEVAIGCARDLAATGALADAADEYQRALACWRGDAYADARGLLPVDAEAVRLDELRLVAAEELGRVHLARGDAPRAVEVLTPAVARAPLRESIAAALMLALHRVGRSSEALRVSAELGRRLDEERGVVLGTELRELESAILLDDASLDWTPPATTTESRGPSTAGRGFVGRRAEIARLCDLLTEPGPAGLVVVSGPPGVGKSSLVAKLAAELTDVATVVVGRCHEDGTADYAPFADILAALESVMPAPVDDVRADLALVAPAVFGDPTAESGIERTRVFDAVVRSIATVDAEVLVLVVEDAHWIDRASLGLLRFLARDPERTRVRIVLTMRDEELGANADVLDALEGLFTERAAERIGLAGLDRDEVAALLRSMVPARAVDAFVDAAAELHRVAGGNPLFVKELVRDIAETMTSAEDVRRRLDTGLPAAVREVTTRRLGRLSPGCRDVLRFAAVASDTLEVDVLAAALDVPEAMVLDGVDEALDARVLAPPREGDAAVTFEHAVTRAAILAEFDRSAQREAHRAIALALESARADALTGRWAELGRHYLGAERPELRPRAAAVARAAGDEATGRFAYEDAADWYGHAVELSDAQDHQTLAELLFARGRSTASSGATDLATTHYVAAADHARAAGDHELLAEIAIANLGKVVIPNFTPLQVELVDEALAHDGGSSLTRVRLLNARSMILYYADHDAERLAISEALDIGRRAGGEALATALCMRHRGLTHSLTPAADRLAAARAAARAADDAADGEFSLLRARVVLSELLATGRFDEFERGMSGFADRAQSLRSAIGRYHAAAMRATWAAAGSDTASAEQLAGAARQLGERYEIPDSLGAFMLHLFMIRRSQDRLVELPVPKLRSAGPGHTTPAGIALAAATLAAAGRLDQVREIVDHVVRDDFAALPWDAYRSGALGLLADTAVRLGDAELCERIATELDRIDDHTIVFGVCGAVVGAREEILASLRTVTPRPTSPPG